MLALKYAIKSEVKMQQKKIFHSHTLLQVGRCTLKPEVENAHLQSENLQTKYNVKYVQFFEAINYGHG